MRVYFMGKCEFCGQEVDLPFQCPFCNRNFCVEHRLPENHSCVNAPPRTPLGPWKAEIRKSELKELPSLQPKTPNVVKCPKCNSERTMITAVEEDFDVFECLNCGFTWKYPGEQEPTLKSKRNKKFAIIGAITVALILIVVVLLSSFAYLPVPRNESSLPIASFIPTKTIDIFVGEEIVFNASLSYDPDNSQGSGIITYTWDFGDGTPIETVSSYTVTHSYVLIKSYEVTLIIVDDDGQNATYTKSIEVEWEVPSISELANWLTLDRTNEMNYDYPDFVCFDFAKMLANHSRQENWKMAVVCISGYDTATNQSWEHAINAINMTEGLVYIEPQTDEVWWYNNYAEMVSGNVHEFWSYPYETVHVYIEDTLVLHLEDLEKYIWVPSPHHACIDLLNLN
jgi:uncharacterized metal-binding protein (TIGR02443 family)